MIIQHDIELRHGIWNDKTETTNLHIRANTMLRQRNSDMRAVYIQVETKGYTDYTSDDR